MAPPHPGSLLQPPLGGSGDFFKRIPDNVSNLGGGGNLFPAKSFFNPPEFQPFEGASI